MMLLVLMSFKQYVNLVLSSYCYEAHKLTQVSSVAVGVDRGQLLAGACASRGSLSARWRVAWGWLASHKPQARSGFVVFYMELDLRLIWTIIYNKVFS